MRPTNQEMDKHKITFTTIYMSKLNRMTSITIIMRELAIEIWVVVAIFVKPQHAVVTSILNCDRSFPAIRPGDTASEPWVECILYASGMCIPPLQINIHHDKIQSRKVSSGMMYGHIKWHGSWNSFDVLHVKCNEMKLYHFQ